MKTVVIYVTAWLGQVEFWHWWVAGAVFAFIELLRPVMFCLWLGIAAGLVGLMAWLVPTLGWKAEFLAFAILAAIVAIAGHVYLRRRASAGGDPKGEL